MTEDNAWPDKCDEICKRYVHIIVTLASIKKEFLLSHKTDPAKKPDGESCRYSSPTPPGVRLYSTVARLFFLWLSASLENEEYLSAQNSLNYTEKIRYQSFSEWFLHESYFYE
jgi:hypothetical protein